MTTEAEHIRLLERQIELLEKLLAAALSREKGLREAITSAYAAFLAACNQRGAKISTAHVSGFVVAGQLLKDAAALANKEDK